MDICRTREACCIGNRCCTTKSVVLGVSVIEGRVWPRGWMWRERRVWYRSLMCHKRRNGRNDIKVLK